MPQPAVRDAFNLLFSTLITGPRLQIRELKKMDHDEIQRQLALTEKRSTGFDRLRERQFL